MPSISSEQVIEELNQRRYVILQGPPGTGKTRLASQLIDSAYNGHGLTIQFHADTTYENFVSGLAPEADPRELGFRFAPCKGELIRAAQAAGSLHGNQNYLLHVDEINRTDLSKVLGEAIYLFEPKASDSLSFRTISEPLLATNFGYLQTSISKAR